MDDYDRASIVLAGLMLGLFATLVVIQVGFVAGWWPQ